VGYRNRGINTRVYDESGTAVIIARLRNWAQLLK